MKVTVTAIERLNNLDLSGHVAKITFMEDRGPGFKNQLFIYVPWHTREDYPLDSVWNMEITNA